MVPRELVFAKDIDYDPEQVKKRLKKKKRLRNKYESSQSEQLS